MRSWVYYIVESGWSIVLFLLEPVVALGGGIWVNYLLASFEPPARCVYFIGVGNSFYSWASWCPDHLPRHPRTGYPLRGYGIFF